MRLIKFRAWHKTRKFMSNVTAIHWDTNQVSLAVSRSGAAQYLWDMGYVELMQFTGLTDKNGKEIYEGDLIECAGQTGEVRYDEQQGAYIILWHPHNEKRKNGCDYLASTHPSPVKEITRNVFENPELK